MDIDYANTNQTTTMKENDIEINKIISEGEERIAFFGTLERKSHERGVLIRFNAENTLLACQSAGNLTLVSFFSSFHCSSQKHTHFTNTHTLTLSHILRFSHVLSLLSFIFQHTFFFFLFLTIEHNIVYLNVTLLNTQERV
jgi:hypothetical protein